MSQFSPRQQLFVAEYLKSKNATQSAIKAGYSKKTAYSQGQRLLKNVEIKRLLQTKLDNATKQAELTAADVLSEIRKLAFVNLADAFKPDGTLKHPKDMPEDVQKALNSVEMDEIRSGRGRIKIGETKKIKLESKTANLGMLAKHFKLLTDITQLQGGDGGPVVILTLPANGSEAPAQEVPPPAVDE